MKVIRMIFRISLITFTVVFVCLVIAFLVLDEPIPQGPSNGGADKLANKMLTAINYDAWENTHFVSWSMMGIHHYLWDKKNNVVQVKWGEIEVILNLEEIKGKAIENGETLSGIDQVDAVQTAWEYFCNDSFWLNAPSKVFDEGTYRTIIETSDNKQALLVTYSSGGITAGDSYLWFLDKNGLPEKYKMWVSIIPIGGLESSWTDWETTSSNARIATKHEIFGMEFSIENLKTGKSLADIDIVENPF